MKIMLLLIGMLGLGALAVHPAEVATLMALAAVGGFLAGATGRHVWRGGDR